MINTKKKCFLILLLTASIAGGAFAQAWYNSYAPGIDNKTFLNAGIGLGSTRGFTMGIPPIQASMDFKLSTSLPITLGATGMFSTWGWSDSFYFNFGLGGRAMYHFNFVRNLDVYTGLTIGWVLSLYDFGFADNYSFLLYGWNTGARYFFSDAFGVYLELGYSSLAFGTIGVTFKMGKSDSASGEGGEARSGSGQVSLDSGQATPGSVQATPGAGRVSPGDSAVSLAPESDFRATIAPDNRSAVIARYNGQAGNIILPGTIQGMPVSQIGEGAFRGNTRVTDVVIPEGVTTIGDNAFNGCPWLTRVTLPSTIRSIGAGAFNDCGELVTVIIPASASIEWHGDAFVGSVKLLLANQAALRQLGYTGGF